MDLSEKIDEYLNEAKLSTLLKKSDDFIDEWKLLEVGLKKDVSFKKLTKSQKKVHGSYEITLYTGDKPIYKEIEKFLKKIGYEIVTSLGVPKFNEDGSIQGQRPITFKNKERKMMVMVKDNFYNEIKGETQIYYYISLHEIKSL